VSVLFGVRGYLWRWGPVHGGGLTSCAQHSPLAKKLNPVNHPIRLRGITLSIRILNERQIPDLLETLVVRRMDGVTEVQRRALKAGAPREVFAHLFEA